MKYTLTLVALRILPGCASYIRKCLSEDTFYYFCNDYNINNDGSRIISSSKYIKPLSDDFFCLREGNNGFKINLQAIVGRNGDGKSSLVEVVIRLINNLSYNYDMNPNKQLLYVNGVRAELYFKYGETFYCVQERSLPNEKDKSTIEIYSFNGNEEGVAERASKLEIDEVKDVMFYTLVSNYSHYSYNTDEFPLEWKDGRISPNESDCWLQRVFHKNDGYQSPIGLHPYRTHGNIDINKERHLSKSRLTTLFLSGGDASKSENDFWGLEDKSFYGLKLVDVGYSKLQEYTIKWYFDEYKHVSLLEGRIDFLKEWLKKDNEAKKKEINLIIDLANAIRKSAHKYFRVGNHGDENQNNLLFKKMLSYAKKNKLLPEESDLKRLFKLVRQVSKIPDFGSIFSECLEDLAIWEKYQAFNLAQIQRIELIDDICDQWRNPGILPVFDQAISIDVKPETITEKYSNLSYEKKCQHYLIYKTISIFETYQEYKYPCRKYAETALYFEGGTVGFNTIMLPNNRLITEPFSMLSMDWAGNSHLTIKLQQTYSFCMVGDENTKKLYDLKERMENIIPKDKLRRVDSNKPLQIHQLPPAIYDWDLVFETVRTGEKILFDLFSSGEKQKMNCLAAIIYHVRNVNSITEATIKYGAVNIILEEIELYFHPEWQRRFCYDMIGLLKSMNLQKVKAVNILLVTHSPYILSDIPKTNVLFLKEGQPVYEMQENTFGANVNGLLKNGFFLPSLPMGEFAHQKINTLFAKLHSGDFNSKELQQIYADIVTVGEPAIRHQLMMLYNTYKQLDNSLDDKVFREFIIKKLNND